MCKASMSVGCNPRRYTLATWGAYGYAWRWIQMHERQISTSCSEGVRMAGAILDAVILAPAIVGHVCHVTPGL